jgi:hypothetical protein
MDWNGYREEKYACFSSIHLLSLFFLDHGHYFDHIDINMICSLGDVRQGLTQ